MSQKANNNSNLSATYYIFGVSALGYAVAFIYQFGYLNFYGVSYRIIDISTAALVTGIAMTVIGIFLTDQLYGMYKSIDESLKPTSNFKKRAKEVLRVFCYVVVPLLVAYFALGGSWHTLLNFLKLFSILLLGTFFITYTLPRLFYIIRYRGDMKRYSKRLSQIRKDKEKTTESALFGTYFDKYFDIVTPVILLLIIALAAGRVVASGQDYLYSTSSKGNIKTVLVLKSNNYLILKDYNTKGKKFLPGFTIDPIDQAITLSERVYVSDRKPTKNTNNLFEGLNR